MRRLSRLAGVLAVTVATGCAGLNDQDTTIPPAELVRFEATLKPERLWVVDAGKGASGLRLGLVPASDGSRIFVAAHDGRVQAFDIADGARAWATKTDLALAGGPGVGRGLVVVGSADGEVVALDAASGSRRWTVNVHSEVISAPAVHEEAVAVRTTNGRLIGLSLLDGDELWTIERTVPPLSLRGSSAPTVIGDLIVAGFDNGKVLAVDAGSGQLQWERTVATPTGANELDRLVDVDASARVVGDALYIVGYQGKVVMLEPRSGRLAWDLELSSYAGLDADVRNVYVTTADDTVVALDRNTRAERWTQDAMLARELTAPTAYGRAVVVGDLEGYVHWLSADDGRFLARIGTGGDAIQVPPLVVGDALFVLNEAGNLVALRAEPPAG